MLNEGGTKLAGALLCYRLSELSTGSTAVFALMPSPGSDEEIPRCGESLLEVLHAHHVDHRRAMEWLVEQPWNWGAYSYQQRDVERAAILIRRVEALQWQVDHDQDRRAATPA